MQLELNIQIKSSIRVYRNFKNGCKLLGDAEGTACAVASDQLPRGLHKLTPCWSLTPRYTIRLCNLTNMAGLTQIPNAM
jgi:hypothetical protein